MNKTIQYIIIALLLIVLSVFALVLFNKEGNNKPKDQLNIYFSKLVGSDVIVEPVKRKLSKVQTPLEQALYELIAGPTQEEKDAGFYTEIPEGTKIIKVTEQPDLVRINLNKQFASGGGTTSTEARLKEVVYTSLDAEPVKKVYLDLDGEELDIIGGEGVEVIQPLSKDNFSNSTTQEEE
ncbi:MAG: GerMN domain-containing protein [Vampirovibrionia bacterium]